MRFSLESVAPNGEETAAGQCAAGVQMNAGLREHDLSPTACQVQWSLLLTQRDLLLDQIKRNRRQLSQVQTDLADFEARFACVIQEIEVFERRSDAVAVGPEEPADYIFAVLRAAH